MRAIVALFAGLQLGLCAPALAMTHASSSKPGSAPSLAVDHDLETAWCAAESPASDGTVSLDGETFPDWWDVELTPGLNVDTDQVGAIHMKSGLYEKDRLSGHKIRNFVWAYQLVGEPADRWHRIKETDGYANRYQLIFRFKPIRDVKRLRLLIRARDPQEKVILGSNNPCLREVAFYSNPNAKIPVRPWFYAVATWGEGANIFAPLMHYDWRAFRVENAVTETLDSFTGSSDPDSFDEMWIGELNNGQNWVIHEPKPAGFLFSGNYQDYDQADPLVFSGFYDFVRKHYSDTPMLGACGGHQLLAMAFVHPTFQDFSTEFARDNASQVVVTCSSNAAYECNGLPAAQCCYEGGFAHPFKHLVPNIPGIAIDNPYSTPRHDMLLNLFSEQTGFEGYLFHSDYVNPERIAPYFDLIATYANEAGHLSRGNPSLVQAMKLRDYPVYGTQFHFDENEAGSCARDEGHRDMDRVLRNFVNIALNRFNDKKSFSVTASSDQAGVGALFDLDRDSAWCSTEPDSHAAALTLDLQRAQRLTKLIMVEGLDAHQAAGQKYVFAVSMDGAHWQHVKTKRQRLFRAQQSCGGLGREDHQSTLTTFESSPTARYLRIKIISNSKTACMSELMLLNL